MAGLMYPAMQKYYSALNSLEKFSKENSFFENISSLDTFFSEFRNITFVLQKSLACTEYKTNYQKHCSYYLNDCKWFNDKRVETTHIRPFQLVKQIKIDMYFPDRSFNVSTTKFTAENDVEMATFIDEFKKIFFSASPIEVFFSAKFTFYEKEGTADIYEDIIAGIRQMRDFLNAMKFDIGENCALCDSIDKKIKEFIFLLLPKDMASTVDYIYYPQKNMFKRAERTALLLGDTRMSMPRISTRAFLSGVFDKINESLFYKFVLMHVIIQNVNLFPTIMTVYKDETCEIDSFGADIKTTAYRKITETAVKIRKGDVQEVFCMNTYAAYPFSPDLLLVSTAERAKQKSIDLLTFMKVDCELNEEEYVFAGDSLKCQAYIAETLRNERKTKLDLGANNMLPIIEAFRQVQEGVGKNV